MGPAPEETDRLGHQPQEAYGSELSHSLWAAESPGGWLATQIPRLGPSPASGGLSGVGSRIVN